MEDFGDLSVQSLLTDLKDTGLDCSSEDCEIVWHSCNGTTDTLGDQKLTPPFKSKQFEKYEHIGAQNIPLELSEFIVESSVNNGVENKPKIYNWTNRYEAASSFLNQNQYDEIQLCNWKAMPLKRSDSNPEFPNSNTTQRNELFSLRNCKTLSCVSNEITFPHQLVDITEENNRIIKEKASMRGHLLSNSRDVDLDITCLESMTSKLSDFIREASIINNIQNNISMLRSSLCCSEPSIDMVSYTGVLESFNTDSKADIPDNSMFIDDTDILLSEDSQSFLEVFTALDNSIESSFCQGIGTSSDRDETERLRSFIKSFFADETITSHQRSLSTVSVKDIVSPSGQEDTRLDSVAERSQLGTEDLSQSSDRLLSQNACITLDMEDVDQIVPSLTSDVNEDNRLKSDCYRRNHREHINYLQRRRVKRLNHAYECLRNALPSHIAKKRLSKLEILQQAIKYIGRLDNDLKSGETTNGQDLANESKKIKN